MLVITRQRRPASLMANFDAQTLDRMGKKGGGTGRGREGEGHSVLTESV